MVSLQDFPTISRFDEVSICERDGRLCTLPVAEFQRSDGGASGLSSYPVINIHRDLYNIPTAATGLRGGDDPRKILIMPTNEPLVKRLARTYFEDGFFETLNEAEKDSQAHPIVGALASHLKRLVDGALRLNTFFWPYARGQGAGSLTKFSETRDWQTNPIRYIAWHPHCFKIAVATSDDSVRIYTDAQRLDDSVPILKSGLQKSITALAWRPFSAGELAVGCRSGFLLWTLDPNTHIIRPMSQVVHFKSGNHMPVTSLTWNHNGTLLATASTNDTDVLMWDVDQNRNTPLKRIGFPCALLKWSPSSQRLCATTVGNVFRVWETNSWAPERWTIPNGAVQSAAWSPCSSYLLFVTTEESLLYSLRFVEEQLLGSDSNPKQALPVADLSSMSIDGVEVGGQPQNICWSPNGKYVAIAFKDSSSIAVFATSINRHLLNISPSFFLNGHTADEYPSFICFQPLYRKSSDTVLTIGWSTGRVQYFPFIC